MNADSFLATAHALLSQPTAPFHEHAVLAAVRALLSPLPHVTIAEDEFGNLVAEYCRGPSVPFFAFAAHLDHPAYVGEEFLGGVPEAYLQKRPPVRSFGPFAMWDLPACELREGRIYSRACDDLIGVAAIVAMFQELETQGAEAACLGLFTRAEEVGLLGAMELAISGRIDPGVKIVSLETSSERGGSGRMGEGVIVRVGDRTSIFDSDTTAALLGVARASGIPTQRALMSGGTCEATAYQLYGYETAGLCVALGNYHNCGPDETIAAEYVALEDALAMARLCAAAASVGVPPNPSDALRERLEENLASYRARFC